MNVLGVCFDSKLNWSMHVANTINKANKALHAIRLIKKYFNQHEILQLLTANFYLILFYNSEIWHLPKLKTDLKQHLLSASAKALKLSKPNPDPFESFVNIHKSCKRALPKQLPEYKHAILLHKIYNEKIPPMDWIELTFNETITSRETFFNTIKTNRNKVGNNILSTRLSVLNNKKIRGSKPHLDTFRLKYKQILITF